MTQITITRNENIIKSIMIYNHSFFNKSGSDIVCASISTLAFYTINAIKQFQKTLFVEAVIDEKKTTISFNTKKNDEISQKLLELLILHLYELSKQYNKNIKIVEK